MKILLLGEPSANTSNWMHALQEQPGVTLQLWSMTRFSGFLKIFSVAIAIVQVRRVIRVFKPDILIGYRTTSYGFIGAFSGFYPLVIAAQGESDVWPPGHWSNFFTSKMARMAIKRAALIHAWGAHMARSLFTLGADQSKVLISHRGIRIDNFRYHKPFQENSRATFICTRSLFPEYHHDLILNTLKALEDHFVDIEFLLVIVGNGNLKNALVEYAKQINIHSEIIWTGRIPPERISDWLGKSDVYISLPDTEGVSSSLLEAMASGCYPIVTDLPANREWIKDSLNGRLVSLDKDCIVEVCKEVIQNRFNLNAEMEENRRVIERLADAKKINAYFIDQYRKLL